MATGAGKTRTVIALADVLMRCNWAKRILFLADGVALVNQAVTAFKKRLPDSSPVNLVTEKNAEGRVFVSTYSTQTNGAQDLRARRRHGAGRVSGLVCPSRQGQSSAKRLRQCPLGRSRKIPCGTGLCPD
jgi:type I restriction enzyme R subunit